MIWKELLRDALKQLDSAKIQDHEWSFGGGTVLMLYYQHRRSKDIDIFFSDPQRLAYISPKVNDAIEDVKSYTEGAIFTKINMQQGEIDFISRPKVTNNPDNAMQFDGRTINLEHPVEIVAKKILFRADSFTIRDIYDLSIVSKHEHSVLMDNKELFADKARTIYTRMSGLLKNQTIDEIALASIIPYDEKSPKINIREHISVVSSLMKEISPTIEKTSQKDHER